MPAPPAIAQLGFLVRRKLRISERGEDELDRGLEPSLIVGRDLRDVALDERRGRRRRRLWPEFLPPFGEILEVGLGCQEFVAVEAEHALFSARGRGRPPLLEANNPLADLPIGVGYELEVSGASC